MAVELQNTLPADLVEGPEHLDGLLESLRSDQRREVVVELRLDLAAEVQEFELVQAAQIADGHDRVHQRHAFMLEQFRVDAPEFGMAQFPEDESGGMAAGRQEHLAARFVRFGFDGAADVIGELLLLNVVVHVVQPIREAVVNAGPVHRQRHLETVAGHPVDVVFRLEEVPDPEGALHLELRQAADFGIRIAEAAVAEEPVAVKTADGGVHRDSGLVQNRFDVTELAAGFALGIEVVLGIFRIPRNQIVVVEAGRLQVSLRGAPGEQPGDFKRIDPFEHRAAEGVREGASDTPERHGTQRDAGSVVLHFHFPLQCCWGSAAVCADAVRIFRVRYSI